MFGLSAYWRPRIACHDQAPSLSSIILTFVQPKPRPAWKDKPSWSPKSARPLIMKESAPTASSMSKSVVDEDRSGNGVDQIERIEHRSPST